MNFPPGYDNPVLRAGIDTITRDALWKNPPPLDADCEHEFRCLPVIEFRVTVLCLKCRGLNIPLSQAIVATPSAFEINPDGVIRASARLRRRDPAEAAELIRAGYREHGIPRELAEAMIEETLRGECGEHHPYPDWPDMQVLCVAKPPYYGPDTRFYGEDAEALGLPLVRAVTPQRDGKPPSA